MFETFASLIVYRMLGLDPASHPGAAVHFFVMDVAKIFVLLVVVIYDRVIPILERILRSPFSRALRTMALGLPTSSGDSGVMVAALMPNTGSIGVPHRRTRELDILDKHIVAVDDRTFTTVFMSEAQAHAAAAGELTGNVDFAAFQADYERIGN